MIFIGVDGLGGPAGGIKKVMDGVLAATFVYPLGVREAVDVESERSCAIPTSSRRRKSRWIPRW